MVRVEGMVGLGFGGVICISVFWEEKGVGFFWNRGRKGEVGFSMGLGRMGSEGRLWILRRRRC